MKSRPGGRRFRQVARLTGLEPATPGVTGRYSNQLSYNRAMAVWLADGPGGVKPKTLARLPAGRQCGAAGRRGAKWRGKATQRRLMWRQRP